MFYRINIWTRSSDTRENVEDIGKQFKYHVLGVPEGKVLGASAKSSGIASDVEFTSHAAAQKRTSVRAGATWATSIRPR
jgi:hypothetical protein